MPRMPCSANVSALSLFSKIRAKVVESSGIDAVASRDDDDLRAAQTAGWLAKIACREQCIFKRTARRIDKHDIELPSDLTVLESIIKHDNIDVFALLACKEHEQTFCAIGLRNDWNAFTRAGILASFVGKMSLPCWCSKASHSNAGLVPVGCEQLHDGGDCRGFPCAAC